MSSTGDLSPTLAELSILRNRVSEANFTYMNAPLGDSYREHKQLKDARREYAEKCVAYVEEMVNNVSKESKEY